jgi:hypothetical protein
MASGVHPATTSVPRDGGLAVLDGAEHVVACSAAGPPVRALLATLAEAGAQRVALLCVACDPPAPAPSTTVVAEDEDALLRLVRERLAGSAVGVRLYVAGSEGFVRRVAAVAADVGLLADELATEVTEPEAFRVACVHCRTITEPVAENVAPCAGCGRTLFVYHHFSRRKGAYMGFQADAEAAGELPAGRRGIPCP